MFGGLGISACKWHVNHLDSRCLLFIQQNLQLAGRPISFFMFGGPSLSHNRASLRNCVQNIGTPKTNTAKKDGSCINCLSHSGKLGPLGSVQSKPSLNSKLDQAEF
jgi:hypothetical protein